MAYCSDIDIFPSGNIFDDVPITVPVKKDVKPVRKIQPDTKYTSRIIKSVKAHNYTEKLTFITVKAGFNTQLLCGVRHATMDGYSVDTSFILYWVTPQS